MLSNIILQFLNWLLFASEETAKSMPSRYYIHALAMYAITLGVAIVLAFRLYSAGRATKTAQNIVRPIFLLSTAYSFTFLVQFANSGLRLISEGTISLKVPIIVYFPLILTLLASMNVVTRLVNVPKFRQHRIKNIKRLITFTIVVMVLSTLYTYSPLYEEGSSAFFTLLGLFTLVNSITLILLIIVLRREGSDNSSKIGRLRLRMLSYGFAGILINFPVGGSFITVMDPTSPYFWMVYVLLVVYNALNIITILIFYASYFTPKWIRKRAGLYFDPSIFQQKKTPA